MAINTCKSCKCKCQIITIQCIIEGNNQLSLDLDIGKIQAALDSAQRLWVLPLMGNTCFDELCAALDDNQQNGTAIPQIWIDFVDEVTPFLTAATEYVYIQKHGRAPINKKGIIFDENFKVSSFREYLSLIKQSVDLEYELFTQWLDSSRANYACLPEVTVDTCKPDFADSSIFETTSGNNRFDVHRHPDYDKFYDFPNRRYPGHYFDGGSSGKKLY